MQKDFETYATTMQQNLYGIQKLMRLSVEKKEAFERAEISGLAFAELNEFSTLFNDDKAVLEPGGGFDEVSNSARFFQSKPTAAANDTDVKQPQPAGWFSWLSGS